jgi:hypothetical protein
MSRSDTAWAITMPGGRGARMARSRDTKLCHNGALRLSISASLAVFRAGGAVGQVGGGVPSYGGAPVQNVRVPRAKALTVT